MNRVAPVALVLAGSRGLGYGCAARLAQDGKSVAVCGRSGEHVETAVRKLAAHSVALGVVADISKSDQVYAAVNQVKRELGPIGILIASAGGPPPGDFDDVTLEHWDAAFHLNLMSFVHSVRAVLPDMRSIGAGRIIVVGSSSIRRPIRSLVLSNTFRPALNGLVKDLAVSLAPDKVTVNVVAPGRIDTERVRQLDATAADRVGRTVDEVRAQSEESIPLGRYGTVEEFAALVGFLASEQASYITGQSILVDGGMTVSLP